MSDVRSAENDRPLKVGDRVSVYDEGLISLAAVMAKYEPNPKPQNEGVIDHIYEDGTAIIIFDAGDAAPYPLTDCTLIDGSPCPIEGPHDCDRSNHG